MPSWVFLRVMSNRSQSLGIWGAYEQPSFIFSACQFTLIYEEDTRERKKELNRVSDSVSPLTFVPTEEKERTEKKKEKWRGIVVFFAVEVVARHHCSLSHFDFGFGGGDNRDNIPEIIMLSGRSMAAAMLAHSSGPPARNSIYTATFEKLSERLQNAIYGMFAPI